MKSKLFFDNLISELDLSGIYKVVDVARNNVYSYLSSFRNDAGYTEKLKTAFGNDFDREVANQLFDDFAQGDFSNIPSIKIVKRDDINGANGAFSRDTNLIYLASEFITENANNPQAITDVLLEETGHFVDAQINTKDAAGDEGDIFARLVEGKSISQQELAVLRAEDDTAIVTLDGQVIQIEMNDPSGTNVGKIGDWWTNWEISGSIYGTNNKDWLGGREGNDTIYGYGEDDLIRGEENNDILYGGQGNDDLSGGEGDDVVIGGTDINDQNINNGDDILYGGTGNDKLYGNGGNDKLYGEDNNDYLDGGDNNDTLYGGTGNDTINGGSGNDTIDGGKGNDWILGEDNSDTIYGGGGNDIIYGGKGNDRIYGYDKSIPYQDEQGGSNKIYGEEGDDFIDTILSNNQDQFVDGGIGNDLIYASSGNDSLFGGEGNDVVWAYWGNDTLWGNSGNDSLYGGGDNDTLWGGDDNDRLDGELGNDIVYGENGNDRLIGQNGNDSLYGGVGDDSLVGEGDNDELYGNEGNDLLDGGWGNDIVYGENGNDRLIGQNGNDSLYGGVGDDSLAGDGDNDQLYGNEGNDLLDGGAGSDTLYGDSGEDMLHTGIIGASDSHLLVGGSGVDTFFMGPAGRGYSSSSFDTIKKISDHTGKLVTIAQSLFKLAGYINPYEAVLNVSISIFGELFALFKDTESTVSPPPVTWSNTVVIKDFSFGDTIVVAKSVHEQWSSSLSDSDATINGITLHGYKITNGDKPYIFLQDEDDSKQPTQDLLRYRFDSKVSPDDPNLFVYYLIPIANKVQGNETLTGRNNADQLFGWEGDDVIKGGGSNDTLNGGAGNDTLDGGSGYDTAVFTGAYINYQVSLLSNGNLQFTDSQPNRNGIDILKDIEQINFNEGGLYQVFKGDDSNNTLTADSNNWALMFGGNGNDILNPGYRQNSTNIVDGGAGDNLLQVDYSSKNNGVGIHLGYNNTDIIYHRAGTFGDNYHLVEFYNIERFEITGTQYADAFEGRTGNDIFKGGAGSDKLTGGGGKDNLTGGTGADIFVYTDLKDSLLNNFDVITDFNANEDKFQIPTVSNFYFYNAGLKVSLNESSINTQLNIENILVGGGGFQPNYAATFTSGGSRYLVINDGTAGFQAGSDAIIQLQNLQGTLTASNFIP